MHFRHIALVLLVIVIWGFNFVFIKIGLAGVSPIFLVFTRFFLTGFPAVFFVKRPAVPIKLLALYGIVMFGLQFSFLFIAMDTSITPSLAAILLQIQVFLSLGLGLLLFKERIYKLQFVGALLAFCGILFIAKNLGGEITLKGFLLVLAAAGCSASGNTILKKMGPMDMGPVVIWASCIASLPLLFVSLYFEGYETIRDGLITLSWKSGGAILYITYLSTFFGFYMWNRILSQYPLSRVAPFTLLSPAIGILGSTLFLHEPLQSWKLFAALMIVSGLGINLLSPLLATRRELIKPLDPSE